MSAGFDFSPRKKGFLDEQRRRGEIVQIVRWRGGGVDKGLRMFIIEGLAINLEGVSRVESGTEIFINGVFIILLENDIQVHQAESTSRNELSKLF